MTVSVIDPAGKLFEHMDRLYEIKNGGRPAPINVEIDLSNRCSLGCSHCHFGFTHTRGPLKGKRDKPKDSIAGGDLMDTHLAFAIVDQLSRAGVCSVTWTGGGEPTLHPDFDKVISHADGKLSQGIYTHGGHIDKARAALLKYAMTFVYVSLDAADRATYRHMKVADRFDNACQGIANLAQADGDAAVGVGYLVTRENWDGAADAVRLAKTLGADYIQFRPTIMYDQQDPSRIDEATGWMTGATAYLEEVAADDPFVIVDFDRFRMYQDWADHPYKTCFWSGLQTVVTPNGKVWSCVNKREHAAALLGDLCDEPFADIWARHRPCKVTGDCRVMCRGHLPNLSLDRIMQSHPHREFV